MEAGKEDTACWQQPGAGRFLCLWLLGAPAGVEGMQAPCFTEGDAEVGQGLDPEQPLYALGWEHGDHVKAGGDEEGRELQMGRDLT